MVNSNLQERSSRKVKNVLKGSSTISALKFGLSLFFFTIFLVACPQPISTPTPTPEPTLLPVAEAPTVEPANDGPVANDAMLVITGGQADATIRYTSGDTDVANPTATGVGTTYTIGTTMLALNSLVLDEGNFPKTVIVKVIAFKPETHRPSQLVTRTYRVAAPAPGPGVTFSVNMLTINEASTGSTGTYTVVLDSEPTADVTVTVMGADTSIATIDTNTSTTALDNTLTFTPSGGAAPWDVEQRVTVTAVDNSVVDGTATLTLTHTASGGGYAIAAADARNVTVTVTDDEEAGVTISRSTLNIDESSTGNYTVRLNTEPAVGTTVILTPSFGTPGVATVSPTVLYFVAANWNSSPPVVTVIPVRDAGLVDETTTISYTVSANTTAGYNGLEASAVGSVIVTVDDDVTAGLTFSQTSLTVSEATANTSYTVKLNTPPTADVTVRLTNPDSGAVTVSGPLMFGSGNWNDPVDVTVTPVRDNDTSDETIMIRHVASGGDYGSVIGDVTVNVTDNNIPATISRAAITVAEGGAVVEYTVSLDTEPTTGTVLVEVSKSGIGSGDISVSPTHLWFARENWNTPQTVTVRANEELVENNINEEGIRIQHTLARDSVGFTPDPAYYGAGASIDLPEVRVTTLDNDPGVRISTTNIRVDEGGPSVRYTVVLTNQPTADPVQINVIRYGSTSITVNRMNLMFTMANWNIPQEVIVTVPDNSVTSSFNERIRHMVHANVGGYTTGLTIPQVVVSIRDNG